MPDVRVSCENTNGRSAVSWQTILIVACLIVAAAAAGAWASEREHAGKFPFEPKAPPIKRWRVGRG